MLSSRLHTGSSCSGRDPRISKARNIWVWKLLPCVCVCVCGFMHCGCLELELPLGFPGGSGYKESACNAGTQVRSLDQEDPLGKGMATQPWLCFHFMPCAGSPSQSDPVEAIPSQKISIDRELQGHPWLTSSIGVSSVACLLVLIISSSTLPLSVAASELAVSL